MNVVGGARSLLVGLLTAAAGFVAAGFVMPAAAPAAEGPRVLMVDNEPDLTRWHFDPAQITVPAGTTVVWFNKGKEDHSVTADDKSFDSGLKKSGTTFSRAFARPGKYAYHCAPHPWMTGTVEVTAGAPVTRTAAAADPSGTAPSPTTAPAPPPVAAPPPASAATTATTAATASPEDTAPTTAPPPTGGAPESSDGSAEKVAAPASHRGGSGDPLAGTLALVLLPTLGALALGAKLRGRQV